MVFGRFVVSDSGEVYLNSYFTDMTEQLKADEQQKKILDNLPCGAALYEYDGKNISVIHINKRYWQLVERDVVDYSNTSILGAIHPDDNDVVQQEITAAIRQKRNIVLDVRIRCAESGYKPFHLVANVIPKAGGLYSFYTFYMPVSEKTMSVQEMLPIALSTVMSSANDISFVKDKELRYLCCSRSMAEAIGVANERELIGKSNYEIFPSELADKYSSDDCALFETGKAMVNIIEQIPCDNGTLRYVKTSKYPLLDSQGSVIGLYGTSSDITETRKTESQLKLLTESIPGGLASFEFNSDTAKTLYYNEGFYSFSGYTRDEYVKITENDPFALIVDEDKPKVLSIIESVKNNSDINEINVTVFTVAKQNRVKFVGSRLKAG